MPLYLFVVSSWPRFLVYLRCKLPVERVEGTLAMGAAARKRRFIGQRALPQERQLFCRKFLLYASPQNHLPLFALGHTHTYMHSLTGCETQAGERSWPATMSTSQQRLKDHTVKNPHDFSCLGAEQLPTLPRPHFSPSPHARRGIYRLKGLTKVIQGDVQN